MPYCLPADVQAEFKKLTVDENSIITDAKLTEWINQAEKEIDGRLTTKYVTPITGTNALAIIKTICVWLVADRVSRILELAAKPPTQGDVKIVKIGTGTAKEARQMLEDIMCGKLDLVDADLRSATKGIKFGTVSCGEPHTYKKNKDQW